MKVVLNFNFKYEFQNLYHLVFNYESLFTSIFHCQNNRFCMKYGRLSSSMKETCPLFNSKFIEESYTVLCNI